MAEHNDLGKWGEEVAARYLQERGYVIKDRDWRFGKRDLDIVALTEDLSTVVFVEVKTRSTEELEPPEEAVDAMKVTNLGIAANSYIKKNDIVEEVRFDIVTVVGDPASTPQIEHIEDAFNPLLL